MERKRILVVAVDFDDDLGRVGIATPLLGKEALINAAIKFGLSRPEDPDTNVLFAAISLSERLRAEGHIAQPAAISGDPRGSYNATLKLRAQLEELVRIYKPDGVIIVSDGSEDELIASAASSIVPVLGVERVVVEQFRGVEETYVLLLKYLKKILEEPRLARQFLGFPGLVLASVAALALVGALREALLVGILIAGIMMSIRGFGLEERIISAITETPVATVAYGISMLAVAIGIGIAASQIVGASSVTPYVIGETLRGVSSIFGFAASIAVLGHGISKLLSGNPRVGREIVALAITIAATMLLSRAADVLQAMETFDLDDLISAMMSTRYALYAIAAVVGVSIVWRVAHYIDSMVEK
jgi:putative membrane protein